MSLLVRKGEVTLFPYKLALTSKSSGRKNAPLIRNVMCKNI